ncbi:13463_t:CDS:1 [Acaulospora colombiana]|uniref:13463_t:CDS:1 n=1 Tax=Acaulospora colombiana TaxID=27376 RepID=A0ACA9PHD0_9GLOM|nr:13463_t:CDS:1 [Acaulospora colombiana]
MEDIGLPTLRDLDLRGVDDMEPGELAWLSLLRLVGQELRTLSLPAAKLHKIYLPEEFWSICPNLEDVFFNVWPAGAPPPEGHPLHTVGLDYLSILDKRYPNDRVLDWPGLHIIRVDIEWDYWRNRGYFLMPPFPLRWFSPNHRVEDRHGDSFEEYLSRVDLSKDVGRSNEGGPFKYFALSAVQRYLLQE